MADEAELASARFAWEDGLRRLRAGAGEPLDRVRRRLVEECVDELRRRMGMTFSTAALADEYRDAATWFLPLASRLAPRHPDAWDPSVVLDAAFALFAQGASDAGRLR